MKTATEIRQGNVRHTFVAKCVYLVLDSLLDWEPMERLKQRSDTISIFSIPPTLFLKF